MNNIVHYYHNGARRTIE